MNICSDKHHDKPSSSRQIFIHVRESETPMRDVRNLLLDILTQYREMDKIGVSLGILDKSASFTDEVSWCAILGKMDHKKDNLDKSSKQHLSYAVNHLDELATNFNERVITQIQQYRDIWMKRVLLWDMLVFALLLALAAGGIYWSGTTPGSEDLAGFFQQRPVFSLLTIFSVIAVMLGIHYIVRRLVINHMLDNLKDMLLPGMCMASALRRNARVWHSIFRPEPVGWSFSQRNRLKSITDKLVEIRATLAEVLANYTDQKAA